MDAVALAKEFAEDCLKGHFNRSELRKWISPYDDPEFDEIARKVQVALDSKIIITIK